jgi:chromosome partitioning protein
MSQCEIIAIANQKGGVGKTTTTFNLGAALASQGKRVLLIDADPQGNLTTYMGWTEDELSVTLNDLLINTLNDRKNNFDSCIKHHSENLDLIPSDIQLSSIEMTLVGAMSREYTMRNSIKELKEKYDYILIDTQPALGMLTINALASADKVIIPLQPQYLAAKGMTQLLSTIIKIRQQINPNIKIDGIVLTIVDKRTNLTKDIYNQLQENYGSAIKIYDTQVPRAIKVAESTAHGKSIFTYDKNSKVAEAYSSLAKEVLIDGKERHKNANSKDYTR